MRALASFRRYLLDHMVSLRHPDILEALIAWCLTSVVRSLELGPDEVRYTGPTEMGVR
jgi:hypothetical protein